MEVQYKTRGIRGATTVEQNSVQEIEKATLELLKLMIKENNIQSDDISSVLFTMTPDLDAEFPAKIARIELGWADVPMMCAQEIAVPNSLKKCIRILILVNTTLKKEELRHVYLGNAKKSKT